MMIHVFTYICMHIFSHTYECNSIRFAGDTRKLKVKKNQNRHLEQSCHNSTIHSTTSI